MARENLVVACFECNNYKGRALLRTTELQQLVAKNRQYEQL